jgi:hypothetical protein
MAMSDALQTQKPICVNDHQRAVHVGYNYKQLDELPLYRLSRPGIWYEVAIVLLAGLYPE